MAGPLFRVAVQVAVMAVGSLSRAFVAAYQQAAASASKLCAAVVAHMQDGKANTHTLVG